MTAAQDPREQDDCPSGDVCDWSCDQHGVFDLIKAKGWEIVEFHLVTHEVTLTADERDAVDLGLSTGVHAAVEYFAKSLPRDS